MSNFSLAQKGANGILSYSAGGGSYKAAVRIREANYSYSVESTESKSRLYRAFYPHRRSLGSFVLHIDCKTYREFHTLQNWLRNYADALQSNAVSSSSTTTIMRAQLANRNFDKYGILTEGIEEHDHVGSMVFDVTLTFMTLRDANDSTISILSTSQVSDFQSPTVDGNLSLAFFPVTTSKYKDSQLYDNLDEVVNPHVSPDPSPVTPITPGGTGGPVRVQ